jgi:hypothetical protein
VTTWGEVRTIRGVQRRITAGTCRRCVGGTPDGAAEGIRAPPSKARNQICSDDTNPAAIKVMYRAANATLENKRRIGRSC